MWEVAKRASSTTIDGSEADGGTVHTLSSDPGFSEDEWAEIRGMKVFDHYQLRAQCSQGAAAEEATRSVHMAEEDWEEGEGHDDEELLRPANVYSKQSESVAVATPTAREELPELSGWLLKTNHSLAACREDWRWLHLQSGLLRVYRATEDEKPCGVIDFSLVDAQVVPLYEDPVDQAARGKEKLKRDMGVNWCSSVCGLGQGRQRSTSATAFFRIQAAGGLRAIDLGLRERSEAMRWVEALRRHIAEAVKPNPEQPLQICETPDDDMWWKVDRVSPEAVEKLGGTGDVLLFSSRGAMPRLIQLVSRSPFDHVGLLIKLSSGKLVVMECTAEHGVAISHWSCFSTHRWHLLYTEVALRRVTFPRTRARLKPFEDWCNAVLGKPYCLNMEKMMRTKSIVERPTAPTDSEEPQPVQLGDESFFCSQMVAEGLKVLGIIPPGLSSTQFWPAMFSAQGAPIECSDDCSFSAEDLIIDFSLSEDPDVREAAASRLEPPAAHVDSSTDMSDFSVWALSSI